VNSHLLALTSSVALLASACAASTSSLADRFVQRGKPAMTVNTRTASPNTQAATEMVSDEVGAALSRGPIPKASDLPTLESENADLKAALAALQAAPTGVAHRRVAEAYFRLRVYDMSYRHYESALRFDQRDAAAYDGIARVWRDWGQPGNGLSPAYRAISLAPKWPAAQNTLGTLLFALGQTGEAVTRFEQVLALDAGAAYARRNLCYVATLTSDAPRAQRYCGE